MTPNKEDYLKCVYELGTNEGKATNKQIAAIMGVSAPAVTEMIKKLISEELLLKQAKEGYVLTEKGLQLVSALVRKHRLLEVFLVERLAYTPEEIHAEAEILEHAVSDNFIDRLEKLLDYPKTCPHGGIIPKKGETLVEAVSVSLEKAVEGKHYVVARVLDNKSLLQYLEKKNIVVGSRLAIKEQDTISELVVVAQEQQITSISHAVAKQIFLVEE